MISISLILMLTHAPVQEVDSRAIIARAAAEAAANEPIRTTPFTCVRDGSTPEINMCGAQDLQREEERMQEYLRHANGVARSMDEVERAFGGPTSQRGYLNSAQSAWAAYASIVCTSAEDRFKDGSIRTMKYLGCMIKMTQERTHLIWKDYLSYSGDGTPVLPQPTDYVSEELRSTPPPEASPSSP